jgi:hypothetical protein
MPKTGHHTAVAAPTPNYTIAQQLPTPISASQQRSHHRPGHRKQDHHSPAEKSGSELVDAIKKANRRARRS